MWTCCLHMRDVYQLRHLTREVYIIKLLSAIREICGNVACACVVYISYLKREIYITEILSATREKNENCWCIKYKARERAYTLFLCPRIDISGTYL